MNVPHGSSIMSCLADMQRHFDIHVAPKLVQKINNKEKKKKITSNDSSENKQLTLKKETISGIYVNHEKEEIGNVLNKEQSQELIQKNVQILFKESVIVKEEPVQEYFEDSTNILDPCLNEMPVVKQEDPLDIFDENIYVKVETENEMINVFKIEDEDWIPIKSSDKEPIKKTKYYCCKYCNKHYKNKGHATRHMKYECLHSQELKRDTHIYCTKCDAKFTRRYALEQHNLNFHSKIEISRVTCKACSKTFKYRRDLLRHIKKSCPASDKLHVTYDCKKCNKKYFTKENLRMHMDKKCDGGKSRFYCDHCDFRTHLKGNLPRHLLRAHDIPFAAPRAVCPKCEKSYKNTVSLTRHLKGECGKVPALSCDFCKYKTSRKFSLGEHIHKKHMKVKGKKK